MAMNLSMNFASTTLSKKKLMARIEKLQGGLAAYEKIKRIALLSSPFSEEKGELTPTLKLRRSVIEEHYRFIIESLYDH